MVRGLDVFKEYFADFTDNYVIIGGSACDVILEEAGFKPRATKDIDMILVVEVLNSEYVKKFLSFIQDGNYEQKEESDDGRNYYRFMKPENKTFPYQVELFSRNPDIKDLREGTHLTPIPVEEGLSSLSAILLDDEYYQYLIEHSEVVDGVHVANTEALIILKAKAWLEISERLVNGIDGEKKHLGKHKKDIFRMALMLDSGSYYELNGRIKEDMQAFGKCHCRRITRNGNV